ncbi:MAG: 4'-phosphopantetheinyl transferase superfamily protein [Acidobacteria bacterium]|nr:4'-phosphopantetheinyl transferase superfamily protein [Acidobacteriota bacterium]MBI3656591.1 4'-phosphopantetheinyl transferase superfamily protein [Acidobacteriota bacterium]
MPFALPYELATGYPIHATYVSELAPDTPNLPITFHRVDIRALNDRVGSNMVDGAWKLKWLSKKEREICGNLSAPKRRQDWLAGRYAAKWAVLDALAAREIDWDRVEILAAQGGPDHGRPLARIDGQWAPVDVSISHSNPIAVACAVSHPRLRIGIDVEQIYEREASFEAVALTAEERRRMASLGAHLRSREATKQWALKEAWLKATGQGLRAPLTTLDIFRRLENPTSFAMAAGGRAATLAGWGWTMQNDMVYAWVALQTV